MREKTSCSGRDLACILEIQDLVGAGQWEQHSRRTPPYQQKSRKSREIWNRERNKG